MTTLFKTVLRGMGLGAVLSASALTAMAQNATISPDATIYGWNGYSSTSYENTETGWYRFGTNGEEQQIWADKFIMTFGTYFNVGYIRDGKICGYYSNSTGGNYIEYDLNSTDGRPVNMVEIDVEGENAHRNLWSGAYNKADDCVYGFGTNVDMSKIYLVKASAADPTNINIVREIPEDFTIMVSCCFNPRDNKMYGVDLLGDMVRCDVFGNFELLALGKDLDYGGTPTMAQWESGMTYSPKDNAFIWNRQFVDYTSDLVKIDADTYKWSKIAGIQQYHQYTFLDTLDHDGSDNGPAQGKCVSIDFADASTSGSVTYTMPVNLSDGNDAPASMTWTATCGEVSKTGTAAPGETVKVEYEGLQQGDGIFNFRADAGECRGATLVNTRWIGNDAPARVENVMMTEIENGRCKLTWTAPDHGAHNGYLDSSKLLYAVFLGDTQLNTPSPECEFEVQLPADLDTRGYNCLVVAVANGMQSEPARSNTIYVGHGYNLPYFIDPNDTDASRMTTINVDGDTSGWRYMREIGQGMCFFSSRDWTNPGDDYLITPPLYFDDPSMVYQINFEVRCHNPQKTGEYFDIWLGSSATVEGIRQQQVAGKTAVSNQKYTRMSFDFEPAAAGRYYLGLHYIGDADQAGIYVRDIRILKTDRPGGLASVNQDDDVKVWTGNGEISVKAAESATVNVFAPDGRAVACATVEGDTRISVAPGIYIVCAGGKTFKVNVR